MILDPFLSSWHTRSECIFKTYWLCPRPKKGLQTSSCPGILAKYCMKSLEDLKRVKLWGSGVGPTSISYLCWWPGVEGESQLNIVSSFQGAWGAVSCVEICSPPCYARRLLSFRLVFGREHSAVVPTCTPATKKQLWSTTTSLVQLKEKERPASPPPPCLLSLRVQLRGICTTDKHFYDKDVQKLPPASFYCQAV